MSCVVGEEVFKGRKGMGEFVGPEGRVETSRSPYRLGRRVEKRDRSDNLSVIA